jgi:hypothetical protein
VGVQGVAQAGVVLVVGGRAVEVDAQAGVVGVDGHAISSSVYHMRAVGWPP